MALAYETEVLRGKEQSVIKVEEGKVISVSGLIKWDIDTLNKVNDSIDGDTITTFKQAFEAFEVRQGVTAAQYYVNHVIDVVEYNTDFVDPSTLVDNVQELKDDFAALLSSGNNGRDRLVVVENKVEQLETDYTALEGRVTAVEA